jgi:hypothetical protein
VGLAGVGRGWAGVRRFETEDACARAAQSRLETGCGWVACGAVICGNLQLGDLHLARVLNVPNNRSKFNTALGIEAQGFCVVK